MLTTLMVAALCGAAAAQQTDTVFAVPANARLTVQSMRGEITVRTWNRSEIRIVADHNRDERIEEVQQAITSLSEEHQMLLAMKYQSGMSCREIAANTGMSLSNIKVSLYRAYEELRKRVKV